MKGSQESDSVGKSSYAGPRSPVRVMQIVEVLADAPGGLSLASLAEQLAIPKTSLLNHLRVMVGTGHLALRDARYVLGPASIRLGIIIAAGSTVQGSLEPVARQLAKDGGETALIAVLDEGPREVVYVGVFEGNQPIRYVPTVGTRRPLYSAAVGRALLAFQDDDYIDAYLRSTPRSRFTAATVTDGARLREILSKAWTNRQAITLGEHLDGVGGIASPVFDRSGKVRYAIGVGVPTTRLKADIGRLSHLVLVAAQKASWALGAREVGPGGAHHQEEKGA